MQVASIKNPPIHIPVLKKEVLSFLDIKPNGTAAKNPQPGCCPTQ